MRPDIHPAYPVTKITCACGHSWETRSTAGELHLDICSACHPFFTGKQKLMDTQGRIERFNKKYANQPAPKVEPKAEAKVETKPKAEKPAKEKKPKAEKAPKAAAEDKAAKA